MQVGGTYAKMLYVEKSVPFDVFQELFFLDPSWKKITNSFLFPCAQNFEYKTGFDIILTFVWLKCLVQHSNIPSKQNKLLGKTGEKKMNVVSDLAISAKKYPKIVTQE